ncbi:MAG: hypothetical protein R2838_10520 [Caldilineaceae bacterium]
MTTIIEPHQRPLVITIYDGGVPAACSPNPRATSTNWTAPSAPDAAVYLYGKEVNDETYAICKSAMISKASPPNTSHPWTPCRLTTPPHALSRSHAERPGVSHGAYRALHHRRRQRGAGPALPGATGHFRSVLSLPRLPRLPSEAASCSSSWTWSTA